MTKPKKVYPKTLYEVDGTPHEAMPIEGWPGWFYTVDAEACYLDVGNGRYIKEQPGTRKVLGVLFDTPTLKAEPTPAPDDDSGKTTYELRHPGEVDYSAASDAVREADVCDREIIVEAFLRRHPKSRAAWNRHMEYVANLESTIKRLTRERNDCADRAAENYAEAKRLAAVVEAAKDYAGYDSKLFLTTSNPEEGDWFKDSMRKAHKRLVAALDALEKE